MVSCLAWVPKGAARVIPELYEVNDDVINELNSGMVDGMKLSKPFSHMDEDANGSDLETPSGKDEDILKALNMDDYDADEEGDDAALQRFLAGRNLTALADPADDPNFVGEDDDEDEEHQRIRPQDSCILVGNTHEDESIMEVYVFDESSNNLYVHHDFVLPSFPLSTVWFNADPRAESGEHVTGSFAAVGTFLPQIEIWNLDVMNPIEPIAVLGGMVEAPPATASKTQKKKALKAKKKAPQFKPGSHTDAVMCMAWHKAVPTRLASGSADTTVKLWDITTQQCVETYTHHKDKVQALEWNPTEHFVMLSGAYDRTAYVMDVRAPGSGVSFSLSADMETARWSAHEPYLFYAATEDGNVTCRDIRNAAAPVWTVQAHNKATSCLSLNRAVPSLFATASVDGTVKIWDTASGKPEAIATRDLSVGKLFAMQFDVSSPFVLAAGGDGGALAIWDTMENIEVNTRYRSRAQELGLGDQELPEEHLEMQRQGLQSKGLGPGREGDSKRRVAAEDSDSDDEDGMRMQMFRPSGHDDDEDDDDEDMYDEDEE